jgi:pSer/pThr/pTyr-binding forkhead associated (FHA) protein
MPLIRCPKCGQSYDVPGVVAVRLPNSIATCHCGEWLSGSKAAVLARIIDVDQIREIDMSQYRVQAAPAGQEAPFVDPAPEDAPPARPRSVRIVARGAWDSVNTVFTIDEHPLWIGRRGCHVELEGAELSLKHCSIFVRGDHLVVRDADSHMGTFLDGQPVKEAVIENGVHLLRVGTAIVSVEPTEQVGLPVEPVVVPEITAAEEAEIEGRMQAARASSAAERTVLVCVEGPLVGQEFEVPESGLVVGREGHVRVPDEFLSRRHFELTRDDDGILRVRDLGSRNGTFLNTLPARNTKVHAGDEITAGNNRFRVERRA